jgi:hypothetical protein
VPDRNRYPEGGLLPRLRKRPPGKQAVKLAQLPAFMGAQCAALPAEAMTNAGFVDEH